MVFYYLSYTLKKITLILLGVLFFTGPLFAGWCQNPPVDSTLARLLTEAVEDTTANLQQEDDTTTTELVKLSPELRRVPDTSITQLKSKKEFEYANDPAYWQREKQTQSRTIPGLTGTFKVFVYLILIILFIYAFYRVVVTSKLHLFYSSGKGSRKKMQQNDVQGEDIDEKIIQYVHAREYRSAVRYMYLKALKLLDAKGWIRFNAKSTNIDYVNEVKKRPGAESFRTLTSNYEYVWYGEFELNDEHFAYLQNKFETFYKSIK